MYVHTFLPLVWLSLYTTAIHQSSLLATRLVNYLFLFAHAKGEKQGPFRRLGQASSVPSLLPDIFVFSRRGSNSSSVKVRPASANFVAVWRLSRSSSSSGRSPCCQDIWQLGVVTSAQYGSHENIWIKSAQGSLSRMINKVSCWGLTHQPHRPPPPPQQYPQQGWQHEIFPAFFFL